MHNQEGCNEFYSSRNISCYHRCGKPNQGSSILTDSLIEVCRIKLARLQKRRIMYMSNYITAHFIG